MNTMLFLIALTLQSSWAHRADSDHTRLDLESNDDTGLDKKEVACYCKDVKSMAECHDYKDPKCPASDKREWGVHCQRPDGPRYFHTGVAKGKGTKPICCKLDYTGLNWKGWGYSKQKDFKNCAKEARAVPANSCCRLTDKFGSFGVRVSKVTSKADHRSRYTAPDIYRKSAPTFELEDIVGGEDYNGEAVPASDVQDFVKLKQAAGRFPKLQCGGSRGTIDKLFADNATSCPLRSGGPDAQCCCQEPTLVTAERCLPADGSPGANEPNEVKVPHQYVAHKTSHGNTVGDLQPPLAPHEPGLQELIQGVADPEADESEMLFDWVRHKSQWEVVECSKHMDVPYERIGWKKVEYHNRNRNDLFYGAQKATYSQSWKIDQCSESKYRRLCPAGQGRYEKKLDKKGTCMNKAEGLVSLGSLSFECPDGYKSNKPGTAKFNKLCQCASSCA